MSEHFDEWNIVKKETDTLTSPIFKKNRGQVFNLYEVR
jgi:hypothetical protein